MRNYSLATIAATICILLFLSTGPRGAAQTLELGIDEEMFTVNGTRKFLVFVSYFDAMDVTATNLHSDFAYLRSKGVAGIRIFPNWWDVAGSLYASDTLIAFNGTLRSASLTKFRSVLDIAKQEGLLVDVSFSAETVTDCPSGSCTCTSGTCSFVSLENFRKGIVSVATNLAAAGSAYKHVLFDLQNEYDKNRVGGKLLTDSEIRSIRNAVKAADPNRIVTASISSTIPAGTAATKETAANLDVIAWHEDRNPYFWNRVDDAIFAIQGVNPDPPIYLQEPERLRPDENDRWLDREGFGADVRGAYVNGAAAWCFHHGGSHRMDGSNLQAKLLAEEKAFLTCLNSYVLTGGC